MRGMKGQTVRDLDLRGGEALPCPPLQCSRMKTSLNAQLFSFSYCFISPQFCFLYPEMVDKLILLENLGFLLAPEVRFHVSFPSLFKIKNKWFFFFPSFVQRKH